MHAGGATECEPFHTTAKESSGRARAATHSCFRPNIFIFPDPRRVQGPRREIPQAHIDRWLIASENPVGRLRYLGPTVRLRDPALLGPSLGSARPSRASVARPHPSAAIAVRGFVAEPSVPRNLADAWHSGPATGVVRSLTPFREFSSLVIGRLRVSEVRGRYGRRWRESETRL